MIYNDDDTVSDDDDDDDDNDDADDDDDDDDKDDDNDDNCGWSRCGQELKKRELDVESTEEQENMEKCENKLQATLVRNYDQPTESITDGGEV